ncbi:hypothetical protein [Spirosoma foliorum]|uniref:Uncharacterized protein n=1 Tax=Spirosoma foliorum TaxID=2710596 RepID=A0A7G5H2K1_9BACT|nr:hypothetical protein [Spirosoma foliorum]QMW05343.1 hypothetical protein H3H32_10860 [Spirosoma foliorum]
MTKVLGEVKGFWLRDVIEALGLSISDAARGMGLNHAKRLYQHMNDESHLGAGHLSAFKKNNPNVNLNYVLSGEPPILLLPEQMKDIALYRATLSDIRNKANEGLGE